MAVELREFLPEDETLLVRYLADPQTVQYLSNRIPQPYTAEDAHWWVTSGSREQIARAVVVDNQLVGAVGVIRGQLEEWYSAEIGYWIGREHWGHGYASQALQMMTDYLFEQTDLVRLAATVFAPNAASVKVLEKCGYEFEARLRKSIFKNGEFYDSLIYTRLR